MIMRVIMGFSYSLYGTYILRSTMVLYVSHMRNIKLYQEVKVNRVRLSGVAVCCKDLVFRSGGGVKGMG